MARKKRRKKSSNTKPRKRIRIREEPPKPPGLRVEDLEPGDLIVFNADPEEGDLPDEIHWILPNKHPGVRDTLRIMDIDNGEFQSDILPCKVQWNYKLERLKNYKISFSSADGEKPSVKLTKRRRRGKNQDESKNKKNVDKKTS